MQGATQFFRAHALTSSGGNVETKQRRGGCVDGHGGADLVQGNAVKQGFHVLQAANRYAYLAYFPLGLGVVGIIANLSWQVKSHRKPGLPLLQQVSKAAVGVGGGCIARILAHGPDSAPVHIGLHSPGIRILTGKAYFIVIIGVPQGGVVGAVQGFNNQTAVGFETFLPLRKSPDNRVQGILAPMFPVL